MPTSRSYREYLIDSLKDPKEAAAYLEAALEEGDNDLLHAALRNVVEARVAANQTIDNQAIDVDEQAHELLKLMRQLTEQPQLNLLSWIKVLNTLGLKLSITSISSKQQIV